MHLPEAVKVITVYIDQELYDLISYHAMKDGRSRTQMIWRKLNESREHWKNEREEDLKGEE